MTCSCVALGLLGRCLAPCVFTTGERKRLVYGGQDLKPVGMLLLFVGTVAVASAYVEGVPEIDASSTVSALALLSGSLLILESRRKK